MDVTKELDMLRKLNRDPINCGNCAKMKTSGIPDGDKVWAQCYRGHLDNRRYVISANNFNALPKNWQRAKECKEFESMLDNATWRTLGIKHAYVSDLLQPLGRCRCVS